MYKDVLLFLQSSIAGTGTPPASSSPQPASPVVSSGATKKKAKERERGDRLEARSSLAQIEEVLVPPLNFAMVAPGVYRSGYPNKRNFPFLKKLRLKSIMYSLSLVLCNLIFYAVNLVNFLLSQVPRRGRSPTRVPEFHGGAGDPDVCSQAQGK